MLGWSGRASPGFTWTHLDSLGFTWTHLNSLDLTRTHLNSLELTRTHLNSLELTWTHQNSLGLTRTHLNSLDLSRTHLNSLGLARTSPKLTRTHPPGPKGKRERGTPAPLVFQFRPHYQTARACVRPNRNDFPVGLTPPTSDFPSQEGLRQRRNLQIIVQASLPRRFRRRLPAFSPALALAT